MEENYEKILWEGYGLRYHGGTRTRTGLVCRTDKGPRELKKARGRAGSIRFAHDVKECLYHNGFTQISRFYTTLEGQPCFIKDGTVYLLEELLPTATLEERDLADFVRGAETLGLMHRSAKGLFSPFGKWDEEQLPLRFEKRRTELAKIKRRIQRQGSYDALDLLVLECYEPYMEQIIKAEALLAEGAYDTQFEKARKEGAFCHQSFKGENLRMEESGRLFVGGFESCTCDLPLLDLAAYLRRYMKKTEGTAEGVAAMLAAYEAQCPLAKEARILLRAMAIYPEKFLRLINEYYNKRRSCVSPAMQERLSATVKEEEKSRKLADFIEYA